MPDNAARLARCFSALFPELTMDEIPRASPASVGAWDSLATINLIALIEEEFGIEIPPDALERMGSYPEMLGYLGEVTGP